MAGGKELKLGAEFRRPGLAEIEDRLVPPTGEPQTHEAGRRARRDYFAMGGDVISMRVRDKGTQLNGASVEPPADLGQMDPVFETNFPGHKNGAGIALRRARIH
jgi:hypothetical protein